MPWQTGDRVMTLRRRSAVVDVVVDMLDGWRRHQSGRNASLLSFFFFLSIFPLLLVATTILGFILQNNDDLQKRIVEGALGNIPVLGQQLANDPTSLDGNVWVLIVGLLTALWSGTKAFVGFQVAQDDIWEISIDDREPMPVQRGRAILGLVIIGVSQIGSLALTTIVNAAGLPGISRILLLLAGLVVNIAVIAFMYRYLTAASPTWRDVWPGAVAAGIAFSVLQYFGSGIVRRITDNAGDTYGQFALVLGLVTWLGFLAISALMAAELNAALVRRRAGDTPADSEPDAWTVVTGRILRE
jgi:membrane protein